VQDIFPTPQRRVLAYSFRSAYRQAIDDLPQTVMGGAKPSQVEIENWKMALEEQARRGESDTAAASGVSESIRLDPAARAAIDKARRIRCYAEPESFDVHNIYNATGAPSPEDMWQAQTALWIQQDVMEAIAAMNEAAAKKLSQGVTPCVLNLPVKHIVGIQTSDYLARDSARQAGRAPRAAAGGAVRPPPEDPSDVFTGRKPGRLFDLMYFRLRVVVEADKVLDLIARLSEKNLYTPIDIEMQDVEQSDDFHGYLYGPDPIVDLQVGFEACFLSSVYGKMVPREAGGEAPGGRGRARR
jgi:hypothetical protein